MCCAIVLLTVTISAHPVWQARSVATDTVATMQSAVITARDLLERIELMPWPGKEKPSQAESIRERALSALIAEKLLAAEFDRSGLSQSAEIRRLYRGLEDVLLRDLLYREEVASQAIVNDEDIREGTARYAEEREIMVFQVRSDTDGVLLAQRLRDRAPADSDLRLYADEVVLRSAPVLVRFGSLDRWVEDMAYRLRMGEVSPPVRSSTDGWLVMALLSRGANAEATEQDPAEQARIVEKVIRARYEAELAKNFYYGLLSRQSARADSAMFETLAEALEGLWREDTTAYREEGEFLFMSGMVDILAKRLEKFLDAPLVFAASGTVSVGEVLELLRYEQFSVPTIDPFQLRLELNERVKAMAANAILAQEARSRGYDRRETIRRDLRVWDDYWKSRALYDSIRDTIEIRQEDMVAFLRSNEAVFADRYEVNVREMLAGSDEEMRVVLNELAEGKDLGEIAGKRTRREAWKLSNGESGFFRIGRYPDIGFHALLAEIGALTGPIPVPEGSSLFVTLGKRLDADRTFDADSFTVELRHRLLDDKRRHRLTSYVNRLADQEGVKVDKAALSRVRMTSINMFTRRYIGFGGIMTAVPMLSSEWDWLMELSKEMQFLP